MAHTSVHDEYIKKHRHLAEHFKIYPDEARAEIAKLSVEAQKPAEAILEIIVSVEEPKARFDAIQKIKSDLSAPVKAEIDDHMAKIASKIGILTLEEIIQRLSKLADHIKAHPDEARARVATLSAATQQPAGDILKIFCSDKTAREKYEECTAIKELLSAEVLKEINDHQEEIAKKIGIVPLRPVLTQDDDDDY